MFIYLFLSVTLVTHVLSLPAKCFILLVQLLATHVIALCSAMFLLLAAHVGDKKCSNYQHAPLCSEILTFEHYI